MDCASLLMTLFWWTRTLGNWLPRMEITPKLTRASSPPSNYRLSDRSRELGSQIPTDKKEEGKNKNSILLDNTDIGKSP